MRISAPLLLATALLCVLPAPAARAAAPSEATLGILQSGTAALLSGQSVWTDYAYDDHGASTSPGASGEATYPSAQDQGNAADLIQLQTRLQGRALTFTAVLETLTRADEPLLAIALDTDSSSSTGASSLPGWTAKGSLGLEYLITASSDGGSLSRWTGSSWQRVSSQQATVDPLRNTVSTTVSLTLGQRLRAVGALGLRRASFLTGAGPIFDLAFVRAEEPNAGSDVGQDIRQADVLAGNLRSSSAVATLDLDALRSKRTEVPSLSTPGYHTMLYRSHVALPEGIVEGTDAGGLWAGPYQPYLVQVPAKATGKLPVLLYLHGGGQNHLNNGVFAPQGPLELAGSLGVFPYGREPTSATDHGYNGVSEQDVLDVLADVRRQFPTDPARAVTMGVSTGGGGAFRMAQLHPDLFSGVFVLSAYDDTGVAENLVNVPIVLVNGGADPLVSPAITSLTQYALDDLGDVGYRVYTVGAHGHGDPAAPVSQCLVDQLLRHRIVRDPARVVLARDPNNDPDLPAGVNLGHDRVYWLSGVRIRPGATGSIHHTLDTPPGYNENAVARIDVTSLAHPVRTMVATPVEETGENITAGATLCGPDAATRSNDAWRIHGIDLSVGSPLPVSNGTTVSLREVSAATLDLTRMRLSTAKPLLLHTTGDGPTTLTLVGPWTGPVLVERDGTPVGVVHPRRGQVVIAQDLAGTHTIRLQPSAGAVRTGAQVVARNGSLPATGLAWQLPALGLSLLVLARCVAHHQERTR